MVVYTLYILWDGEPAPLLVTTDKHLAELELNATKQRWEDNGLDKELWIAEREMAENSTVFFDYDWIVEDTPEDIYGYEEE